MPTSRNDPPALLRDLRDAHVEFELARWRGATAARRAAAEEVEAVHGWLTTRALREVLPPERARAWVHEAVETLPVDVLDEQVVEEVAWATRAVRESLADEGTTGADVLGQERFDQLASAVIGLEGLRQEGLRQATESAVYAELISHVLYHGLKNYLLTENAMVKKMPGASSLVRLGQNAMRAAHPNLEAGIDRRLKAFVSSNVAETVRDSRAFLTDLLSDGMLGTITAEIWTTNAPRPLADLAALVDDESVDAIVGAGLSAWERLRASPVVARAVDAVVDQFYAAHGDDPVTDVLDSLGLTVARLAEGAGALAETFLVDGEGQAFLRSFVERRLDAFYTSYAAGPSKH